jgi:hypothetical protein
VGVPVGRRLDLVRRRHALLDEMERRHAAGVESWLASKACSDADLERYVLGRGAGRR